MYLSNLNEKLKKLFLNFAYLIAKADGEFSESEKNLLNSYSVELQMECNIETLTLEIDDILKEIKENANETEYKIIIFEAVGIAMSDGDYSEPEKEIIKKAQIDFGLSDNFEKLCELLIGKYLNLQADINNLVLAN